MKLTVLLTAGLAALAAPAFACPYKGTAELPTSSSVAELPPLLPVPPATGS